MVADSVPHQHPDEATGDGDIEAVERWLQNRMGTLHVDCTDGIRVGNYDACEDLDEEYRSLLEQHASVERALGKENTTAERYNETRRRQLEYAELRQEFNATFEQYERARSRGDDDRARALARDLQQLAERLETLGDELDVRFRELDSSLDADLSSSREAINESTRAVRTVTIGVETESFEPTRISTTIDSRAAFGRPATVTGEITTKNGSRVAGGRVLLNDGEQTFSTPVTTAGTYEFAYQPTTVTLGERRLVARYVPSNGSRYLQSNTSVSTAIQGTPSTVVISSVSDSVAVGEKLRVAGDVRAAGRGVGRVPVVVSAAGTTIASTRTNSNGSFAVREPFPAGVPDGIEQLNVTASESGRAIRPSHDTRLLTVEETPTSLRVAATHGNGTVAVTGRLIAANDARVGERPVSVTVQGAVYDLTTDSNGYYRIEHPIDGNESVTDVNATYAEADSNLRSSTATTDLEDDGPLAAITAGLVSGFGDTAAFVRSNPGISGAIFVGVFLNAGLWVTIIRRRRNGDSTADSEVSPAESASSSDEPSFGRPSTDVLLEGARNHVNGDPEAAVRTGYAAVRTNLDDGGEQKTHWEFYRSIGSELPGEQHSSLRSLTESFERVAFSPGSIDRDTAEAALDDAERCLSVRN